ncbi:MAG: hypothetical protein QN157_10415 [Armatimonadota bacterium]|nr:hypothetical protein [Armatimonadota bacterium]
MALGAVVVGLVGSLLVAGLNIWRRGRDLQEAQAHAAVLVDAVARDVRNASQTPGVIVQPRVPVDDGEPVLAVMPAAGPEASGEWIVYVFRRGRGEVLRQRYTADAQGRMVQQGSRMVATGVVGFTVEPADGGVTVEVEVRRGRVRGQARTTAAPRNP